MGFHPETPSVRDTFDVEPFSLSGDSAVTFALLHRPELLAAGVTAAAWALHLPTLTAFGNWTWSNFDFPLYSRWNEGVTLSIPVFQGFSIDAQTDQAKAGAEIAQATVEQLRESITLDVQQAFWALQEARERTVATGKLVQQAEENLTLAEKQYAAGVAPPLDVSDAQLALSSARTTDIQAQYDASSSLARIRRAMGVMTFPE